MRFRKAFSLLMILTMVFAALSLSAAATDTLTDETDTSTEQTVTTTSLPTSHYLWLSYDAEQGFVEPEPEGAFYGGHYWYYWGFHGYPDVEITITPKEGYVINSITSWKDLSGTWVSETIPVSEPTGSVTIEKSMYCDRKISAKFEKVITFTATALASPEDGGTVTVNGEPSVSVAPEIEVAFEAEPNDGYEFLGWYDGDLFLTENETYSLAINKDTTLTAVFLEEQEEVYHQVILDTIGEGSVTGAGTYIHGTEVAVGATPGEGYTFVGWFEGQPIQLMALSEDSDEEEDLCLVSEDNPYSFELLEDTSLIAKFVELTHQVTLDRIGDGTVTGAGTYTHGANLDVSATPDSGWHFDNWYYGGETLNPVEYPVTTDMAITAKFLKDQKPDPRPSSGSSSRSETKYTLNVSVEGDGSVLPEGTRTYSKGTTVVLVPTPNEGSVLMGWFGEDGGEVVDNTLLMNGDKSIIVRFSSEEEAVPETEEPVLEPEPEEEIVVILDNEIPISSPDLPQTGGIPLELLLASGTLMITGGIAVRRKRRKN